MIQQESKKKKKATSNLNSGEKTNIIQQNFQKSTINLKNMKTTARITFPFPPQAHQSSQSPRGSRKQHQKTMIHSQATQGDQAWCRRSQKRRKNELSNIMRL